MPATTPDFPTATGPTPADRARRRLLDSHGLRVGPETAEYAARCADRGGRFSVLGGCARTGRARRLTVANGKVAADQRAAVG